MVDFFSKEKRSYIMSRIRSTNTRQEIELRKALRARGLVGYRIYKKLPGKPDVVFSKSRVVIFLDGDFWHGYNWKVLGRAPPRKYWRRKIERTIERDKEYTTILEHDGWKVLRFWEHDVRRNMKKCIKRIEIALKRT